jgi:hypothetical protein
MRSELRTASSRMCLRRKNLSNPGHPEIFDRVRQRIELSGGSMNYWKPIAIVESVLLVVAGVALLRFHHHDAGRFQLISKETGAALDTKTGKMCSIVSKVRPTTGPPIDDIAKDVGSDRTNDKFDWYKYPTLGPDGKPVDFNGRPYCEDPR